MTLEYTVGTIFSGVSGMRFVLTYEGQLPSNGNPKVKHAIRQQIHPQLKRQWETDPTLQLWSAGKLSLMPGMTFKVARSGGAMQMSPTIPVRQINGFSFLPLVTRELSLVCSLEITFLRSEEPGHLISGGDIDNRIKTLLDSLSVPKKDQLLKIKEPQDSDSPYFYCLLEDDSLVTGFSVKTERLLKPLDASKMDSVHLLIAVVVRPTQVTLENVRLLGGWL